jgi:hypothetical protein
VAVTCLIPATSSRISIRAFEILRSIPFRNYLVLFLSSGPYLKMMHQRQTLSILQTLNKPKSLRKPKSLKNPKSSKELQLHQAISHWRIYPQVAQVLSLPYYANKQGLSHQFQKSNHLLPAVHQGKGISISTLQKQVRAEIQNALEYPMTSTGNGMDIPKVLMTSWG